MKIKNVIISAVAGGLLTQAALAQVEVTITGSTAFRSIVQDRVPTLFDAGFVTTTRDANIRTYSGTMQTAIPSLGNTPVTVRLSWSGSASGMISVKNGASVNTVDSGDTNNLVGKVPDLAFSDVFPGSANPPIPSSAFSKRDVVGVVPFVFARNNSAALAGVDNLTRDQALLLMTAGGIMPANYLGGSQSTIVYLVGRDSGSGTRISIEKDIAFKGTPFLFAKIGANWVATNGFSSGSAVASTINTNTDAIGYLGLADFSTISANAVALSFGGVPYSSANVTSGKYALWGYEHVVSRIGISANQQSIRNALKAAIVDPTYQSTNPNYAGKFESVADMQVERGADGGTITSLNF
jgi:ABC-type phosphate transport system substrate-binding protein